MPACSEAVQPMTASVSTRTGAPGVTGMTIGWPCAVTAIEPVPVKLQLNRPPAFMPALLIRRMS